MRVRSEPNDRLQRQGPVLVVLDTDVDVAAGAHRLVVVDVPVDADDDRRHARERQVCEHQPWVGGNRQRHPHLIEARLRLPHLVKS